MSTPNHARALVLETPRHLVERTFELPAIGPNDGLLRVEACGLCGTDHEQYTGQLHPGRPFVPGHETVGIVEQLGQAAAERWGVQRGDRVAVQVFQACGECRACEAGDHRHCRKHGMATMYGFQGTDVPPSLWGGYATHQYLSPDSMLLPVPAGLDPVLATMFNPLGAGIQWGVTLPGTTTGDRMAILGPGIRGLCACAAAKSAGAEFVMVTGAGERDHPRLAAAERFGADLVVDVTDADPVAAFRRATSSSGASIVLDVTANAPAAFAQGVALARAGGTFVVAGTRGQPTPDFHADHIVYKELRILGALGVDTEAYEEALDLLASDRFPFAELSRMAVPLDAVDRLLQSMAGEGDPPPVHGVVQPGPPT